MDGWAWDDCFTSLSGAAASNRSVLISRSATSRNWGAARYKKVLDSALTQT